MAHQKKNNQKINKLVKSKKKIKGPSKNLAQVKNNRFLLLQDWILIKFEKEIKFNFDLFFSTSTIPIWFIYNILLWNEEPRKKKPKIIIQKIAFQ